MEGPDEDAAKADMEPQDEPTTISDLSPEILLQIFEFDLSPSAISNYMLCCKRWWHLVSPVRYKHVVLTMEALFRWSKQPSDSMDAMIQTFTLRLHPGLEPVTTSMRGRLYLGLFMLASRLVKLVNLRSLSVVAPKSSTPFETGLRVPESLIASVLNNLPRTCVGLEIDIEEMTYKGGKMDLCQSISGILPRLRFLRLNLPHICPRAFGTGFDHAHTSSVAPDFEPIEAPNLEQCIIKVAKIEPRNLIRSSMICDDSMAEVVAVLATYLQAFKSTTNTPKLQKLWILDALRRVEKHISFQSLVRRDIIANKSWALPYMNITGGVISIRMPAEEGGMDLISDVDGVNGLLEGHAWIGANRGSRIPASEISNGLGLTIVRPVVELAEDWAATSKMKCLLWSAERRTGTRLVDVVEGGLTEDCIPRMQLPLGWKLNASNTNVVRIMQEE
ncbi:hypothetical protein F5Y05DRAFT_421422 [Hypoxylon sp. FL0543]|nr:hypothetical protein F5Y05DRAFT_421422 [Hypoxylon sp. FL0543]